MYYGAYSSIFLAAVGFFSKSSVISSRNSNPVVKIIKLAILASFCGCLMTAPFIYLRYGYSNLSELNDIDGILSKIKIYKHGELSRILDSKTKNK